MRRKLLSSLILALICVPVAAQNTDLKALIDTGRYAEAEAAARKSGSHHELAEVLATTGRYAEAIKEFELAAKEATPKQALEYDLRRGELLELTGQEAQAKTIYESFIKYYTENNPQTAAELTIIARALVHLDRFQDANDLYRAAIEADAGYLEAQLSAGELYTRKYQFGDAALFLADALKLSPNSARVQLDIALNKRNEGGAEMLAALNKALTLNPNYVEALNLKAALSLEAGQFEAASSDLEKALKVNPQSLEAHALRGSMYYLQDRDFEPEIAATLAIGPHYGEVYNTLAHYGTITSR